MPQSLHESALFPAAAEKSKESELLASLHLDPARPKDIFEEIRRKNAQREQQESIIREVVRAQEELEQSFLNAERISSQFSHSPNSPLLHAQYTASTAAAAHTSMNLLAIFLRVNLDLLIQNEEICKSLEVSLQRVFTNQYRIIFTDILSSMASAPQQRKNLIIIIEHIERLATFLSIKEAHYLHNDRFSGACTSWIGAVFIIQGALHSRMLFLNHTVENEKQQAQASGNPDWETLLTPNTILQALIPDKLHQVDAIFSNWLTSVATLPISQQIAILNSFIVFCERIPKQNNLHDFYFIHTALSTILLVHQHIDPSILLARYTLDPSHFPIPEKSFIDRLSGILTHWLEDWLEASLSDSQKQYSFQRLISLLSNNDFPHHLMSDVLFKLLRHIERLLGYEQPPGTPEFLTSLKDTLLPLLDKEEYALSQLANLWLIEDTVSTSLERLKPLTSSRSKPTRDPTFPLLQPYELDWYLKVPFEHLPIVLYLNILWCQYQQMLASKNQRMLLHLMTQTSPFMRRFCFYLQNMSFERFITFNSVAFCAVLLNLAQNFHDLSTEPITNASQICSDYLTFEYEIYETMQRLLVFLHSQNLLDARSQKDLVEAKKQLPKKITRLKKLQARKQQALSATSQASGSTAVPIDVTALTEYLRELNLEEQAQKEAEKKAAQEAEKKAREAAKKEERAARRVARSERQKKEIDFSETMDIDLIAQQFEAILQKDKYEEVKQRIISVFNPSKDPEYLVMQFPSLIQAANQFLNKTLLFGLYIQIAEFYLDRAQRNDYSKFRQNYLCSDDSQPDGENWQRGRYDFVERAKENFTRCIEFAHRAIDYLGFATHLPLKTDDITNELKAVQQINTAAHRLLENIEEHDVHQFESDRTSRSTAFKKWARERQQSQGDSSTLFQSEKSTSAEKEDAETGATRDLVLHLLISPKEKLEHINPRNLFADESETRELDVRDIPVNSLSPT